MRIHYPASAVLIFLALNFFAAANRPASAQGAAVSVDKLARSHMSAAHIPGLTLAVVKNGQLIYAKGYGYANVELSAPATPQTIYPIGSLSKQFTAAAIILLAQDSKLKLDDPIVPLLPKLHLPAAWNAITVRDLLNQTSGLQSYTLYGSKDPEKDPFLKSWSPQEIVDLIADKPLTSTPGAAFEYSNTNYYLLALIVEALSGQDIYAYLKLRVFHPFGMTATGQFDPTEVTQHRAARYVWIQKQLYDNVFDTDPSYYIGAGGIQSSVLDLAKWDAALYANRPLTAASKQAMWSAPKIGGARSYGFGWVLGSVSGHRLIWHNGAIPGAMSWMGRYIDDKLTVIVLCNLMDMDNLGAEENQMQALGQEVAALYDPALKPLSALKSAAKGQVDPADFAVCRKAVDDILTGKPDAAMYTDAAAKALYPDRLKQTGAMLKTLGELKSIDALGETMRGGSRVITCRATFASAPVVYDFYLEPRTRKIQGILPRQ